MHKTLPPRFDLRNLGLTEAQLKTIAGARPAEHTKLVTSPVVRTCCWA